MELCQQENQPAVALACHRPLDRPSPCLYFWTTKDEVFLKLKQLLEPFSIKKYCTDGWGTYERHLPIDKHEVSKRKAQKIEHKYLNLRTRIKRLARKIMCFSKSEEMHDLVIRLLLTATSLS